MPKHYPWGRVTLDEIARAQKELDDNFRALADGIDGAGGGAWVLVAASNATAAEKTAAAYTCDGTSDDVEIQAAIDTGQNVVLSSGTFTLGTDIEQTSVTVRGNGSADASAPTTVDLNGNDWNVNTGCRLAELHFTGDSSSNILLDGNNMILDRVSATDIENVASDGSITNTHLRNCHFDLLGEVYFAPASRCSWVECDITTDDRNALGGLGTDNWIIGCRITSTAITGVLATGGNRVTIVGNYFSGNANTYAIGFAGAHSIFANNHVNVTSPDVGTGQLNAAVQVQGSNSIIVGNTCKGLGILLYDTTSVDVSNNVVVGNMVYQARGPGVWATIGAHDNLIANNVIEDASYGSSGTYDGIALLDFGTSTSSPNNAITNNVVRSSGTYQVGHVVSVQNSDFEDTLVWGNDGYGAYATGGLDDSGTGTRTEPDPGITATPSGSAGGHLSGTYPNPSVDEMESIDGSASTPAIRMANDPDTGLHWVNLGNGIMVLGFGGVKTYEWDEDQHYPTTDGGPNLGTASKRYGTGYFKDEVVVDGENVLTEASGEINALTEKATPVMDDLLLIEDSAASNAKKKVQVENLPLVATSLTTTQSVGDSSGTEITFGVGEEDWDTEDFHDTSTNKARVTPSIPGLYRVTAYASFDNDTDGDRRNVIVRKNGSNFRQFGFNPRSTGSTEVIGTLTMDLNGSTDYVSVRIFHDAGNNLNVEVNFQVERIGPRP